MGTACARDTDVALVDFEPAGIKRVPVDPALLAVTLVLALIGVVMVFSASAVVAAIAFTTWYFLKRQVAWLVAWPAGHARDFADRLHDLEEVGDSAALRGHPLVDLGADSVARQCSEGRTALAAPQGRSISSRPSWRSSSPSSMWRPID